MDVPQEKGSGREKRDLDSMKKLTSPRVLIVFANDTTAKAEDDTQVDFSSYPFNLTKNKFVWIEDATHKDDCNFFP